jgi:hypothetical protein
MPRQEVSGTVINFALQSTFTLCLQLPRSLLHGLDLHARLHWSPHEPRLLAVSVSCAPNHRIRGPERRAAACLEAVVRRLDSRRM